MAELGARNQPSKKAIILKLSLLIILLVAIVAGGFLYKRLSRLDGVQVRFENYSIHVDIADSPQERERGLCCRNNLDENRGMLFVYEQPGDYRFWMKDTKIPLDMYWISSDKRIVHIEKNVQPSSYPNSFGTDTPAQYILETNAGFADKHNINVGDNLEF